MEKRKRNVRAWAMGILLTCALFAVALLLPAWGTTQARAETVSEDGATITLDQESDFTIENGVLKGIAADISAYTNVIVKIPAGVTEIYGEVDVAFFSITVKSAFKECTKLTEVHIPSSVTKIGEGAFYGCSSLTEVEIPDSVTQLGKAVFKGCYNLTKVTIPSVCTIGYSTQDMWDNHGTFPDSLKTVYINGDTSDLYSTLKFLVRKGLKSFRIYDNAIKEEITDITIDLESCEGVVDNFLFYGNESIQTVRMNGSIKSIANDDSNKILFTGCKNLTSLYVTDLAALASLRFNEDNRGVFSVNPNGVDLYVNDEKIDVLDLTGFSKIGNYVFAGANFTEVKTGDLTQIPEGAFYDCKKLQKLTVSDTLEGIGRSAFEKCKQLSTVAIDKENSALVKIYKSAFRDCVALTEFVVPASMPVPDSGKTKGIYNNPGSNANQQVQNAFYGCTNLTKVTDWTPIGADGKTVLSIIPNEKTNGRIAEYADTVVTRAGTNVMRAADQNGYVFYEEGSSGHNYLYKYTGDATELTLPADYNEKKYEIFPRAFYQNNTITKLTVPRDSVTVIGDSAFMLCSELVTAEIQSVDTIGNSVFNACRKLRNVTIRGDLNSIGDSAFNGCTNLVDFSIDESNLQAIGNSAFNGCSSLGAIALPDTVKTIGHSAFAGCGNLGIVKLSANLESIGQSAFAQTKLTQVALPRTLKKLGEKAFNDCTLLETVTFEDGSQLEKIEPNTFINTGIRRLELPDSITEIGGYAFAGCSRLEYLKLPANLKVAYPGTANTIGLIYRGTALKTVVLPASLSDKELGFAHPETPWQFALFFNNQTDTAAKKEPNSYFNNLKTDLEQLSDLVFIAPNKTTYDAYIAAYEGNEEWQTLYGSRLFYEDTFTFTLKQGDETIASIQEKKLVSNDGADIRYTQNNGYWTIDETYALPSKVGMYFADNTQWGLADKLTSESAKEYVQTVTDLRIEVPDDQSVAYGEKLTVPEEYANALTLSRITNEKGGTVAVSSIPSAGVYTVYVQLKSGYAWSDGTTTGEKSYTVTVTPAEIEAVWTFDGNTDFSTAEYTGLAGYKALVRAMYGTTEFATVVYRTDDPTKTPLNTLIEVGSYTFEILTNNYGNYVITNPTHEFVIAPARIDVSEDLLHNLTIDLAGSSSLSSGVLYLYQNEDRLIPSYTQLNRYTLVGVVDAQNSIARYVNATITLEAVLAGDAHHFDITAENNSRQEIGVCRTVFTVTAHDNYLFTATDGLDGTDGLSVTVSADGKTVTIEKTWYVVQLENELVMSNAASMENVYKIADWTYGDDVTVGLPRLWKGDEDASWAGDDSHVKFTLHKAGVADAIVSNAGRSTLLNYVNKYMPAGHYTLLVTVSAFDTDEASYPTFSRRYEFTVAKAAIGIDTTKYSDYEWELTDNADKEQFFKKFADAIGVAGVLTTVTQTAPEGEGNYWATDAGKTYFGDYAVTYNFARMNNETYYSANDNDLLGAIDGNKPDTYTVYFQISQPNHENLTDTVAEGRYQYTFKVTVYKTLAVPSVADDGLVYTGSKVLPTIAASELYEAVWSADDSYIAGGAHSVSFKLFDNVHYRWQGVSGDAVSVNYTVKQAENVFTVSLNLLGWQYDCFDAAVNNIRAAARFLDAGQSIRFKVTKKGENEAVTGLGNFGIDALGKVDGTIAGLLKGLPTGEYTLYATVAATGNYLPLERNVDFRVDKATNTWADGNEDLQLPSWVVGKYNADENPIVVNAAHGNVNIVIADIDGNEYYNSVTGVNKLGECGVGKYLLRAWVDETEDYAALAERTFTIEVLEKIGLPWWGTLLIVLGALLVAAAIIFILWKKGVFQILTGKIVLAIRTRASVDATIASVRAAKMTEEGKQSVADAKRRERIEEMRKKAAEQRALPPEERAAQLEARAQAEAEKAEKSLARSEALKAKASKMRGGSEQEPKAEEKEEVAEEATEQAPAGEVAESEAAATNEAEE